jgi:hypothetical protein
MKYKDNIMDDLAAYGIARDEAKDMSSKTNQDGTPVFGFEDVGNEYEITAGKPFDLVDYNVDLAIIAPDTNGFNLIVRKENPEALHNLPKDKLRNILSRILDSV